MNKRRVISVSVILVAAVAVTSALASSGGSYVLDWFTIGGGGGSSAGGAYVLSGIIDQPDGGEMSGGAYTLSGGFWPRRATIVVSLPTVHGTLYRFPNLIQAGSAASGPNQWYGKVVPGTTGNEGDPLHFVVWLHVPADWQLPWARQYSFTGDFSSTVMSPDPAAQAWMEAGGNCALVGGPASAGYKWRALRGPEERMPAAAARLNNLVNLRGGLRVPGDETPGMYAEVVMVVGMYFDSGVDGTPDSYTCSGGAVPAITVE